MGWSEAHCQFCGVSFNIARKRKLGEPQTASWRFSGDELLEWELPVDELDQRECLRLGCALAIVEPNEEDDLVNDPAFVVNKSSSGGENDDASSDGDTTGDEEEEQEQQQIEEKEKQEEALYRDFLAQLNFGQRGFSGEPVGPWVYASTSIPFVKDILIPMPCDSPPDGYSFDDLEHIPGPDCPQVDAYLGSAISLAEMRGCRTVQFLVHRSLANDSPWQADGVHEPWEESEEWFLSGLADGMDSRDGGADYVWPARGGMKEIWEADNVNLDPERFGPVDLAMPFHPWCFDIFSRQSKLHFGNKVNIAGLIKWWNTEWDYDTHRNFPRHPHVTDGQQQTWAHDSATAYLAANPLYIPGLAEFLLDAAQQEGHCGIGLDEKDEKSGFALVENKSQDRLSALPLDLRLHVINFLDSGDIMRLRQASKAFIHLPNHVWYRIVRGEMPWLWEAWEEGELDHVPSPWTVLTANEAKVIDEQRDRYTAVLRHEDEYTTALDNVVDHLLPWPTAVPDQGLLSKNDTNWYSVFRQIRSHWLRVRGLRNRARIWTDVEEVIRRIEKHDSQRYISLV